MGTQRKDGRLQAGERGLGEPALLTPRPSISGLWNCGKAQVCYLSLSVPELYYRRPSKQIQNFTMSSERNDTKTKMARSHLYNKGEKTDKTWVVKL